MRFRFARFFRACGRFVFVNGLEFWPSRSIEFQRTFEFGWRYWRTFARHIRNATGRREMRFDRFVLWLVSV